MSENHKARRFRRVAAAVLLVAAASAVHADQMGSGDPSPTNDTELGFIVFQQNCTSCHGNPAVERAPTPAQLRSMAPERIFTALTTGTMKAVGDTLTDTQRRKVAASLGGRPLGTGISGDARNMPNRCARDATPIDPANDPHWNGWGVDLANTRFQPADNARLDAASVPKLKLLWAFGLPNSSSSYSQPTVVSGRVFVGADTGYIYSLDAKSGCVHWSYRAKAGVRNAMTVGPIRGFPGVRNAVFFGDLLANLYALDAQSGRLLWKRHVGEHFSNRITAAPALHDGRLYVPVSSWEGIAASTKDYPCCQSIGAVVAVDANNGKPRWRTPVIPDGPKPLGRNAAGTMLFGPAGAPVWNTPTVDVARRRVYFGTGDATTFPAAPTSDAVMAVDMDSGKVAWTYQVFKNDSFLVGCPVKEPVNNCPKVQGPDYDIPASVTLRRVNGRDLIYVATKPGDILTLDPDRDGTLVWRKNLTGAVVGEYPAGSTTGLATQSTGVMWGGSIGSTISYFGLTGGGVAAMRTADGEPVWFKSFDVPAGKRVGNAAAATGTPSAVFVGSADGTLYALAPGDGATLWQFNTNRSFDAVNKVITKGGSILSGGAVVVDGRVYVGSGFGVVGGITGNAVLAFGVE
jgi:polyvinyl alcohol dehydrogenase (cytochrome)